jgi:hypothetical protein
MKESSLIKQTSETTGTGDLTLGVASSGFRPFSAAFTLKPSGFQTDPQFVPYMAKTADGSEWEVGICQVADDAGNGALNRSGNGAVVLESSNAGSLVNFTAATEVSLITPPRSLVASRGCTLFDQVGNSMTPGGRMTWEGETYDSDACWDSGDADFIYIPLWASEVIVEWTLNHTTPLAADQLIGAYIDQFSCENEDLYAAGVRWATTSAFITGQFRLTAQGSSIQGNPVDNGDRAGFAIAFANPDNVSATTAGTSRLRMRVIR